MRNRSKHKLWLRLSVAAFALSIPGLGLARATDQATNTAGVQFEGEARPEDGLMVRDNVIGSAPVSVPGNNHVNYAANAKIGKITVEVDRSSLHADGFTPARAVVHVYDRDGTLMADDVYVTVELGGTARIKFAEGQTDELGGKATDLDRATPGSQIKVTNGILEFDVLAPTVAGDVDLRVTGGTAQAGGKLSYVTEKRPLFVIGILEGIISKYRLNPGTIGAINSNDGFEQDLQHWSRQFSDGTVVAGRAAFFAKGQLTKDITLTASYDSDKDLRARLMRDISPELYYPVTGDASITGFDARTSGRGYLRLDSGRAYAMFGDFNTGDGFSQLGGGGAVAGINVRKLGAYNRTVTGVRLHNENSNYTANVFGMYDRLRQTVEQYPLNGTSILPFADAKNAIVDSEKVEIVTYDKNVRTQIVNVTPLVRYQDYAFEPFNGRIRLLGGDVNALDVNGNPRFIRVTYENDQESTGSFFSYGGDAQVKLGSGLEIGGNYAREENPSSPFTLYSLNTTARLGAKTVVVAEYARSEANSYVQADGSTSTYSTGSAGEQTLSLKGEAWRVEGVHESDGIRLKGFYEQIDPRFVNQSIGLTSGQTTLGASADVKLAKNLSLYADASRIQDRVANNHPARESEEGGLRWQASDRLLLSGGIHRIHEDAGLTSQTNLPGNYGGIFNPNGLTLSGANFGNPGLTNIANTKPIDTVTARIGIDYKFTNRLSFQGDAEHAISDANHNRFAIGASYQLSERTRAFARYEDQTGLGSGLSLNQGDRSSAFVAGFDSSYREGSTVYSEYRLRDAESGQNIRVHDMQLASGIRRSWQAGDGLRLSSNVEYLKIFTGAARDALGMGIGADFTRSKDWKGSVRAEFRRVFDDKIAPGDQNQDQYLLTASMAHKLSPDWTLLARNYFLYNKYNQNEQGVVVGDILQDRIQVGAAWRPRDTDKIAALFRYDYKIYRDEATVDGVNYSAHLASMSFNYHPSRRWWFDGRVAGQIRKDVLPNAVTGGTQTSRFDALLASGRAIYDITDRFDISIMGAHTWSNQKAREHALGGEVGYLLAKNVWISGGYNWHGFDNPDLSGTEYHNRGFFLRLRIKFSESLTHF